MRVGVGVVASSLALAAGIGIGLLLDRGEHQTTVSDAGTVPQGPAGVQVERRYLAASGAAPEQVLVSWNGWEQPRPGRYESGLSIWERTPNSRVVRWHAVYAERFPNLGALYLQLGDVTRDGHEDVLVEASRGSGGCGVRNVLATVDGRVREIYRSPRMCEATFSISGATLSIVESIGPCPHPGPQSAHCRGGERRTVRRWDGEELVAVRTSVTCDVPRLDPARGCRARR